MHLQDPPSTRAWVLTAAGACLAAALLAHPEAARAETPDTAVAAAQAEPPALTARKRDFRARRAQPMDEVVEHAAAILPYAALATTVYCDGIREVDGEEARKQHEGCNHQGELKDFGWQPLRAYPRDSTVVGLKTTGTWRGLYFAVYYRDAGPGEPVDLGVAFRGTNFTSWTDWHSNLRWFLPGRDQYDVVAEVARDVIDDAKREVVRRLGRDVASWHIVSTGHSLGGGLAQLFAYKSTEVRGAVAFDPSPVTGYHSCVNDAEVNCNVPVWRVYERGEVLAWLRAFTRLFYPLSENITELEFDLLGGSRVANHDMTRFYVQMRGELQRRPIPALRHARLFEEKLDCTCLRDRRPHDYLARQEACLRLAAERDAPSRQAQADALVAQQGGAQP